MATAETLKAIVENGRNLVLLKSVRAELLYELAEIASRTGANLTVPTTLRATIASDLAARYGKTITFSIRHQCCSNLFPSCNHYPMLLLPSLAVAVQMEDLEFWQACHFRIQT